MPLEVEREMQTAVAPALGYVMILSSVITLGWCVLRSGLAFVVLRRRDASVIADVPVTA